MNEKHQTPYEAIGGDAVITKLVTTFYNKVGKHPDLTPIFPDDLTETIRKQRQFLTQYLGGPQLYTEEHGHPMMRARHMQFPITPKRGRAWLACMSEAMDEIGLEGPLREAIYERLVLTAQHMVNTPDEPQEKGESV
ncbi:globin [Bacillus solimangrovi]|uniref:Globin n=1 Tax=Bacillus solimangrovi TaxID=1305675 RepID=A0A1E5LBZ4_9BACI|nr:globin [Bacillus solimangrovi]OEH91606.1 globin [Bacillus solimangrovi]